MSEWKLILNEDDVLNLRILLKECKKEFIKDRRVGREPLFNELTLLHCLSIIKEEGWVFGSHHIQSKRLNHRKKPRKDECVCGGKMKIKNGTWFCEFEGGKDGN